MNTVIKKIRAQLVHLNQDTLDVRRSIQRLKWIDGSQPEIQRLRSVKDNEGRRVNGKRSLKPYHRPETGPARNILWLSKWGLGYHIRVRLLLLAMLNGKEYKTVEVKCREGNYPPIYWMIQILEGCFEEGKCPIGFNEIDNWVKGAPATKLVEEAA